MATSCELEKTNQQMKYTFRFGTTDQVIHITEEELTCFPYLSGLVKHNINFSSIKNTDGEYVLDSRIRYDWFMPIFKAITTGHPSALFTELSQKSSVRGMLELYGYLCVNPIPVPIFKDENLVQTKSDDIEEKKFRVEYSQVKNLVEIRDIAAQFIIALSYDKYNFEDSDTLNSIFSLTMTILSNPIIFDVGLCHHMLTVIKALYFSLFSCSQQQQMQQVEQYINSTWISSLKHLFHDGKILLRNFPNAFIWKEKHVIIEENGTSDGCYKFNKIVTYDRNSLERIDMICKSSDIDIYYPDFEIVKYDPIPNRTYTKKQLLSSFEEIKENGTSHEVCDLWLKLPSIMSESNLNDLFAVLPNRALKIIKNADNEEVYIYQAKEEHKKIESKSA